MKKMRKKKMKKTNKIDSIKHDDTNCFCTSRNSGVFHPSLEQGFVIVEMDLNKKMRPEALKTTKGIGNIGAECTEGMTSIEYANASSVAPLRETL
jgi:hypothetical protein